MSNINFANPYLLLILIPVLFLIVIPFVITFKKDNIGIRNIISLVLHVLISVLIIFVIAGMSYKSAIDETNIYVLADVSYSANRNLDTIDKYVATLEENADNKTKVGVVCFGNDTPYVLTTPGEKLKSVKVAIDNERVSQDGTDIAGALRYTASLFSDSVIKRIILITDGHTTSNDNVLNVVNELYNQQVYVDAIYLDDNLPSDEAEVQINGVNYTLSTYQDKSESVQVTIQSNTEEATSKVSLYKDGTLLTERAPSLSKGLNIITIPLDTTTAGEFTYEVEVETHDDNSPYNNTYRFTQSVTSNVKILYLASDNDEKALANTYFKKDNTDVTYLNVSEGRVPYTIEDLCFYDEFILSDVDVTKVNNSNQFVTNLELVVSRYAKTLITLGNTYTQNGNEDYEYKTLSNMLPIKYGQGARDGKLIVLLIDISKSMNESYHLSTAKSAASRIVDLASESDNIMVLTLSGETSFLQISTPVTDESRLNIKNKIAEIGDRQGTLIGSSLRETYNNISSLPFLQKQIYLISDGRNMSSDPVNAVQMAGEIYSDSNKTTTISCVGIGRDDGTKLLENIASAAHGKYYTASDIEDLEELFDNELGDEVGSSVIPTGPNYDVVINKESDLSLDGISDLEDVRGMYTGSVKNSATSVLDVLYGTNLADYEYPLYAYWRYGNGLVASFSCDINSKYWLSHWGSGSNGEKFLQNLSIANLPSEREDVPLIINIDQRGETSYLSVNTPSLNPNAKLELTITYPDGSVLKRELVYTTEDYQTNFEANLVGNFKLNISYNLNNVSYTKEYNYDISYSEEYNSFTYYEISNLNHMVNNGNPVYEDADSVDLSIDETKSTTFTYDFTVLFMTIAICLFVIDIFIRKVKWADIKQLFSRHEKA